MISDRTVQALNFTLEGAQQFSSGKQHFFEDNFNLCRNFVEKDTAAKAHGKMGVVGYFETCSARSGNCF